MDRCGATPTGASYRLVANTAIFQPRRPLAAPGGSHYAVVAAGADQPTGEVENEDYVCALLLTREKVRVTFEASRVAVGDQNNYGFVVHGTKGQLAWDFRRPGDRLCRAGGRRLHRLPTRRRHRHRV
jgi:predicted dehydrogenase